MAGERAVTVTQAIPLALTALRIPPNPADDHLPAAAAMASGTLMG
jgi:hypothetical protein